MDHERDEYWFPCAAQFSQLAMREAVTDYLSAHRDTNDTSTDNLHTTEEEEFFLSYVLHVIKVIYSEL